jgi:hypothetical protein
MVYHPEILLSFRVALLFWPRTTRFTPAPVPLALEVYFSWGFEFVILFLIVDIFWSVVYLVVILILCVIFELDT